MVQLQSSSNSKLHKVCWEIEQRGFFFPSLLTGQFTDKSYTMLCVLSFIYVKACTTQHVSRAFFLIYISPIVQPWWWRHGEIWMRFFMAKHCILFMGDLSVKSILSINTLTKILSDTTPGRNKAISIRFSHFHEKMNFAPCHLHKPHETGHRIRAVE